VDGIVATNTTILREGLKTDKAELEEIGAGGLSGKPLARRSTEVIAYLRAGMGKSYPIIGVGGIETGADMLEKMQAGADLVQVYTGFIYQGPSIVKIILNG
jgi:dihydroorotate dehydrogenase